MNNAPLIIHYICTLKFLLEFSWRITNFKNHHTKYNKIFVYVNIIFFVFITFWSDKIRIFILKKVICEIGK